MLEKIGNLAMPTLVVLFATISFVNLREAQSLRSDRTHRLPQFSAGQLPKLVEKEYKALGRTDKVRLSSLSAPFLAIYFVKANDCMAIIPEVEDLKTRFSSSLDIAVFALDFSNDEVQQLGRLFPNKQLVLECGDCKDLDKMHLPKTPHRLLIERTSRKLLLEERPVVSKEERSGLLMKVERIMIQRGHSVPNAS